MMKWDTKLGCFSVVAVTDCCYIDNGQQGIIIAERRTEAESLVTDSIKYTQCVP